MKTDKARILRSTTPRISPALALGLAAAMSTLGSSSGFAQATWVGDTSADWNTAANWSSDPANPSGNFTINTATGNFPVLSAASAFTPTDLLLANGGSNSARFDHTAGALSLANVTATGGNWAFVARSANTATATYNLANTSVADGGISGFAQGSGSLTVGKLFVGGGYFANGGVGTANINTSGTINANSTQNFSGQGNASVALGVGTGASGTINLQSGTINSAGQFWVGNIGTGTVNQTGGTVNVTGILLLARNNSATQTGDGTWNVSGSGTVNVENDLVVAYAGNASAQGTLNINTGGTVNVATTTERWMIVNQFDSAQGQLNVNGGTLNLNANTDLRFSRSNGVGASAVTLTSGTITSYSGNGTGSSTTGVVDLNQAGGAAANNTFNLDGGTLTISQIITNNDNGTATFNFNGGTLRASNSTGAVIGAGPATVGNFLDLGGAGQTAVVKAGGAIIDSNGFNVTVSQALLNGTGGGGLTKNGLGTLTLSGANTFIGDSTINSGGVTIGSTGSMLFAVTDGGSTNVLGSGSFTFDGAMKLDLSAVTVTNGSWQLVDTGTLATSFGGTFAVQDNSGLLTFSKAGSVWTSNDSLWSFSETNGTLSVVPEPSTCAALVGALGLGLAALRRRRA